MPSSAQMELIEIQGRELKLWWKSPRFGEWLAWCYVPAASLLHQEGVGFEERAPTAEAAKAAVLAKVEAHLTAAA